jgi:arylsulfatase A-like enzyme
MGHAKRPNVIIICCDDLGAGDLGCCGSVTAKTPNVDALAQNGIRFTSWYANSALCSPSRAALLTGQYPARNGVRHVYGGKRGTAGMKPSVTSLPRLFKSAGYDTGICGKWHLGGTPETGPNAHGFDEFYGFLSGCVDYFSHIFYWRQGQGVNPVHDLWHNSEEVWANGTYLTEWITEKAVSFIDAHKGPGAAPFFLYVPYNAPHFPMHVPQRYLDRFPDLPFDRRIMAAMIAAVDDGVGEMIAALRRTGQFNDTLIFFTSDHGPSSQSVNYLDGTEGPYYGGDTGGLRGHKGSLFEGGIRVPAILHYPAGEKMGLVGGRVCDGVGVMMDLVPTLAEAAGYSIPAGGPVDGKNVLPMLIEKRGKDWSPHKRVFWELAGQWAVREGRWKLVKNGMLDLSRPAPDALFLADLESDPGEERNLAGQHPEIAAGLEQALDAWAAELGINN